MKIAIDARYLAARSSGIGAYTWHLLSELGALAGDLEFLLLTRERCIDPPLPKDRFDEVVVNVEPRSFVTLGGLRWILPSDIQLFHCPFNLRPLGLRCPTVTTIHDIMWLQSPFNITINPLAWIGAGLYWRLSVSHAIRTADSLLTVSQATRTAVIERFGSSVSRRIAVTPNGLDPFFLEEEGRDDESLVASIVPTEDPYVLVVGNLSRHKNHHNALRAFLRATNTTRKIRLVFVRRSARWDPEMTFLLLKQARDGRVIPIAEVSRETLRALYRRAAVFFFPSTVEGFGIPIIEAMACGCPVVTSNCGAMAEVAGEAAELVSPSDIGSMTHGLKRVLEDRDYAQELRRRGRKRARLFTWKRCAELTLDVYRQLVV